MSTEEKNTLTSHIVSLLKIASIWGASYVIVFNMGVYYKGLTNRLDGYDKNFIEYKQKNTEQDASIKDLLTDQEEIKTNLSTLQNDHINLVNNFNTYLHIKNYR